jgi:hypothetical protein
MTTSPQSGLPPEWFSDKVDLDELFRDATLRPSPGHAQQGRL